MSQTAENGKNRRFLPLVLFKQYVCTSIELKTLKAQNTVV